MCGFTDSFDDRHGPPPGPPQGYQDGYQGYGAPSGQLYFLNRRAALAYSATRASAYATLRDSELWASISGSWKRSSTTLLPIFAVYGKEKSLMCA